MDEGPGGLQSMRVTKQSGKTERLKDNSKVARLPGLKPHLNQRRQWHPHSSTFAWKIPWTEEPGGLQSMGLLRAGDNGATSLSLFTFMHWRRKWQPSPVSCLENPRDREPGGLPSMGSHRVGHDCSDLAAAAAVINMYVTFNSC